MNVNNELRVDSIWHENSLISQTGCFKTIVYLKLHSQGEQEVK